MKLQGSKIRSRTHVASVGSVFNDTRKVKVLSLPETIKEKSKFRVSNSRRRASLETSIFPLLFQVMREPLPFVFQNTAYQDISGMSLAL